MLVKISYCPYCFDQLKSWGEMPTSVFEHICEYYAIHGTAVIIEDCVWGSPNLMTIVNFLESKGYIITTECGDIEIAAVPMVIEEIKDIWMICVNNTEHGFID